MHRRRNMLLKVYISFVKKKMCKHIFPCGVDFDMRKCSIIKKKLITTKKIFMSKTVKIVDKRQCLIF